VARWRALAIEKATYVGEPVAMVLAETAYVARDAVDLVQVDYEPLPVVTDAAHGLAPDAPIIHDYLGTNQAFTYVLGSPDTDEALNQADEVVRLSIKQRRLAGVALEPRATLAQYDPYTEGLVVWTSTQSPHLTQHALAATLGIPEHKIRVITRDMGGGFGLKGQVYGDDAAIVFAAWSRKCSIRWAESRHESFLAMAQGRGMNSDVTLGIRRDGTLVAVRVEILCDMGSVIPPTGAVPPLLFSAMIAGPYRIPKATAHTTGVYTNRPPTVPYRGAGRPEAVYSLERAVDLAARAIGMDPAEVRRRNFIGPDEFPYTTPTRSTYDSGNYAPALEKALQAVGYPQLRREQERLRAEGRYLGIGICSFVEVSVPQAWESGTVRVDRGGKVTLLTGSSAHGQGHHTTFAQIVADVFGVPIDDVEVMHGDTAAVPVGVGTFGSRSAALGGSSAFVAASRVKSKMQQIAANLLEASADDIQLADGRLSVAGVPERGMAFAAVAGACYAGQGLSPGMSPGLEETEFFNAPDMVYPFGTHVAVVEVNPETGDVQFLRYVAVDDCGNIINPLLVDGQVLGGVAQGLGQALLEEIVYDESGQLATGTLMDYAVPRASTMPKIELDHTVTPTPHNPLGVKGVGEAGTAASPPAVVNAIIDALVPFGVTNIDMPLTAPKIWDAIQASGRQPPSPPAGEG
jgi:carbon-monoxide dehydrogenase large subunit